MDKYKLVEADVLVIGGGGAGLRATLEAKKTVDTIVVASKGFVGKSGNTPISGGAFQADKKNFDAHIEDTIRGGADINHRELVKILATEAWYSMSELEKYGCETVRKSSRIVLVKTGLTAKRGSEITRCLADSAARAGVKFLESVMISDLLTEERSVVGAVGFHVKKGYFVVFKAKSTVLATGGLGQLYERNSNAAGITGDGYAMAYRAGADLTGMEFTQFYPTISLYPISGYLIWPNVFPDGGRLLNALGERFMKRYAPEKADLALRDVKSRGMFIEVQEGRGIRGGVHLDYSKIAREVIENRYRADLNLFLRKGVDIRREPVVVGPVCHYFMGGVQVNEKCETSLGGLYAAGEVVGGIHGANRLGGNALTETQVFGARAGKFAASRAATIRMPELELDQAEKIIEKAVAYLKRKGVSPTGTIKNIRALAWDKLGIVKDVDGIDEARSELRRIRSEELPKIAALKPTDFVSILELINMLDAAEMIAESSFLRTESRGAHYRRDFPKRDDKNWKKNIVVYFRDDELKTETREA